MGYSRGTGYEYYERTRLQQLIQEQEWKSINNKIKLLLLVNY